MRTSQLLIALVGLFSLGCIRVPDESTMLPEHDAPRRVSDNIVLNAKELETLDQIKRNSWTYKVNDGCDWNEPTNSRPFSFDEFWGGMWLRTSKEGPGIHLSPSRITDAWGGLVAFLHDEDPILRESAARWLRALGRNALASSPYLMATLDDPDERVRVAVREALLVVDPEWSTMQAIVELDRD